MSDAPYDRYRQALALGHLALLRGATEQAIDAYREAAKTLPDRSTPHRGLGRAYLAAGLPEQALDAFEAALSHTPDDLVALDEAARALLELEREDDAAGLLDRLATIHLEQGREVDARAALQRAIEIAGSPWRRLMLERLHGGPPEPSRVQLRWLADLPGSPGHPPSQRTTADSASRPIPDELRTLAERVETARRGDDVPGLVAGARALARAGRLRAAALACHDALLVAPADPDVHRALAAIDRQRGWQRAAGQKLRIVERYQRIVDDPEALDRAGESAVVTGDIEQVLLVAVRHAENGRIATALDLLFQALAATPGEPRLYLAIARLHLALGWRGRSVAEVDRLERFAAATADDATRDSVAAFVNDAFGPGVRAAPPAD